MVDIKSKVRMALVGVTADLTLGGAMIGSTTSAEASYRGGYYGGFHRAGYYPGFYGHRHYRPYGGYYGGGGGAVAAGLIGGLALGALAARPYYGPGYYAPAYYARPVYGGGCYVRRSRFVNRFGEVVIRRDRVCG